MPGDKHVLQKQHEGRIGLRGHQKAILLIRALICWGTWIDVDGQYSGFETYALVVMETEAKHSLETKMAALKQSTI